MVKHIVLFKLKNPLDKQKAADALNSMKGKINGLIDLEVGFDFLKSDRSFDLALVCTLESRKALQYYQEHPVHQPVKELMAKLREISVACDYEI